MKIRIVYTVILVSLSACTQGGSITPTVFTAGEGPAPLSNPVPPVNLGPAATAKLVPGEAIIIAKRTRDFSHKIQLRLDVNRSQSLGTKACDEKSCQCQFVWDQVMGSGEAATHVKRSVRTPMNLVQDFVMECFAPIDYLHEIPDGSVFEVRILKVDPENGVEVISTPITMRRDDEGMGEEGGATTDVVKPTEESKKCSDKGACFTDVSHYVCYQKIKKAARIMSRTLNESITTTSGTAEVKALYANRFCVNETASEECQQGGSYLSSAQSYYFNFYLPSWKPGNFNNQNQVFTCPNVDRPLDGSQVPKPWPMSTDFALSLKWSPETNVGVQAYSVIGLEDDATGHSDSAFCKDLQGRDVDGGRQGTDPKTISARCLGYAILPNPDASCTKVSIKENGVESMRQTVRIRRYVAIYPVQFGSDGKALEQQQQMDVVYVADRLSASGQFTYRGPLPCPFAYFDRSGKVSGGTPAYWGTNRGGWTGKNVDGVIFPNKDDKNAGLCAASMLTPQKNAEGAVVDFKFVTRTDPVHVRGVSPYYLHYEEDKTFRACSLPADQPSDPPLHFQGTRWCSEVYPNKHGSPESLKSGVGVSTLRADTVHEGASARVVQQTVSDARLPYPLLAPKEDIEDVLKNDLNYACAITSRGGVPVNDAGVTPSAGCCAQGGSHLEPGTPCQAPTN